ncbi:MAG TPA: serine hydrolase [Cellulomonas sp.]
MNQSLPRSIPEEQGVDPRAVLATLDAIVANPELHSLMVVRHGNVIAEGWAAPFGPDRPHALYSLSKTFTATAVGFAVAEGLLTLDDRVVALLPEHAPTTPDERLARMTVRHLLTMSGGHDPEPTMIDTPGDWLATFLATPLAHEPGERFIYNTPGTYVLSAIVQRVTGQHLLDYLTPRLLEPLGIVGATTEVSPQGIDLGGVGMSVRTEDVAKLGLLYLQDGMWQGRRVLPEGWVAQAGAAQVSTAHWAGVDWQQGYGFQMWRSQHGFRADGAFGQFSLVLPDEDTVVAITGAFRDTGAVLDAVWRLLLPGLHRRPLPPDDEGRAALEAQLAGLRLDPPSGQAITATAVRLSRRTVVFDDNPLGVVSASFAAGGVADELVVRWTGGAVTFHPGHAEPVPQSLTNPLQKRQSPASLVSGTWTDADRYVLSVRHVETPHAWTVTVDVDEDRVVVTPRVNVAFEATEFGPLVGHVLPAGQVPSA